MATPFPGLVRAKEATAGLYSPVWDPEGSWSAAWARHAENTRATCPRSWARPSGDVLHLWGVSEGMSGDPSDKWEVRKAQRAVRRRPKQHAQGSDSSWQEMPRPRGGAA